MAETNEQPGGDLPQTADQEWLRNYLGEHLGQVEPGTHIGPAAKKKPGTALLFALVIALAALGGLVVAKGRPGAHPSGGSASDLGQGVSSAAGVRGHLVTAWQDKAAHYKIKIEPIDFSETEGFARAAASNPQPLYFNLRVLDAVGDAICSKQLVLQAAGSAPPAGADAFKRLMAKSGSVEGLWAEGTLPCSAEQFARFSYWDFTTNFPTVAEQDKMRGIAPRVNAEEAGAAGSRAQLAQQASAAHAASASQRVPKKPQSTFLQQGDDHATSFEPGRNVLTIGPGKSFVVLRPVDLHTAAAWADDSALVHYACDQQAICSLRRSGSAVVVLARMNN